jgi:hypothetical protein
MYVIYIVLFYRYTNHVFVSCVVRANHMDEYKLPPTIRNVCHLYVAKVFLC